MQLAALIGVFAEEAGVGAREIDEFKDALANGNVVVAQAHAAVFQRAGLHDDHFAGLHFAHVFGFEQVEGAAFGGEHPGVAHFGHAERVEAVRIAYGVNAAFAEKQ